MVLVVTYENQIPRFARYVLISHHVRPVPPPPYVPVLKPGSFGFVENAERWNSRASMVGWWSLLLVELVAGKGLLEIFGFTVGKGINFTF